MALRDDDPRPTVWVLMVKVCDVGVRTVVVNLLDVPAWAAGGYVIVMRDPFTVMDWHDWRRRHPEAK